MEKFTKHTGKVVPLYRTNVDTDQIIPAVHLKRIERSGWGQFLFERWRQNDPNFVLNRSEYADGSVLVAGDNFGCGSSREHAPWALQQAGFKAIIAPSFADIFFGNCCQNGLLPVVLPEAQVMVLARRAEADGEYRVTVDLTARRVTDGEGFDAAFPFDEYRRDMLLEGLDEIGKTLLEEARIAAFERRRASLALGGPA